MEFITDYLSLIIKDRNYYKDRDKLELIDKLTESKLAILDGQGHCELTGGYCRTGGKWIKDKGVFYSNDGYLPTKLFANHGSLFEDDWHIGSASPYEAYYDPDAGHYDFESCRTGYCHTDGIGFDGFEQPCGICPVDEEDDYRYCLYCKNYGVCYMDDERETQILKEAYAND